MLKVHNIYETDLHQILAFIQFHNLDLKLIRTSDGHVFIGFYEHILPLPLLEAVFEQFSFDTGNYFIVCKYEYVPLRGWDIYFVVVKEIVTVEVEDNETW